MARYDLVVFTEALGVSIPFAHPAVIRWAEIPKAMPKHAPMAPTEFILLIEEEEEADNKDNKDNPEGIRMYLSGIPLLTMDSLIFRDALDISELRLSGIAVVGTSLNHKDKNGNEMQRAAPSSGFTTEGDWARPLFRMWKGAMPEKKAYSYLFPTLTVNGKWIFRNLGRRGRCKRRCLESHRNSDPRN